MYYETITLIFRGKKSKEVEDDAHDKRRGQMFAEN